MNNPFRQSEQTDGPSRIVNMISVFNGEWVIVLDDQGRLWSAPVGRNNSTGGYMPNDIYYPILGRWRQPGRASRLPQNLHILPKGARVTRLCGATSGGFARERDAAWIKKFLRNGGGLCPECAKRFDAKTGEVRA